MLSCSHVANPCFSIRVLLGWSNEPNQLLQLQVWCCDQASALQSIGCGDGYHCQHCVRLSGRNGACLTGWHYIYNTYYLQEVQTHKEKMKKMNWVYIYGTSTEMNWFPNQYHSFMIIAHLFFSGSGSSSSSKSATKVVNRLIIHENSVACCGTIKRRHQYLPINRLIYITLTIDLLLAIPSVRWIEVFRLMIHSV